MEIKTDIHAHMHTSGTVCCKKGLTKQQFFSTGTEQAGGCQTQLIAADKDKPRLKKGK